MKCYLMLHFISNFTEWKIPIYGLSFQWVNYVSYESFYALAITMAGAGTLCVEPVRSYVPTSIAPVMTSLWSWEQSYQD